MIYMYVLHLFFGGSTVPPFFKDFWRSVSGFQTFRLWG